jgi:mannobiose 2-epimerase
VLEVRRRPHLTHLTSALSTAERDKIAAEMLEHLRLDVTNAWFPRCVDREAGGFFCDFDRRWKPCGPQQRMLEFQARQTRAAARLALAFPHESRWAELALHGFRYLRDAMWDRQHGGWYWIIGRDGVPLRQASKHAHSTAYSVDACVVVHLATGDPAALELAYEGFDWFDRHGHDNTFGGYHSWLRRNGTVLRIGDTDKADPLGHDPGLKSVNVHGDWLEALTDLARVQLDAAVHRRLQQLARLFLRHLVTSDGGLHYACHEDWQPQAGLERYGYAFQSVYRFINGSDLFEEPEQFRCAARRLLDHALRRSRATQSGGFWYAGPGGEPSELEHVSVIVKRRTWWTQLEALRSLAVFSLLEAPDETRYVGLFRTQWHFIRDHMCDKSFGGLYPTFPGDLRRRERLFGRWCNSSALHKGNIWKDASHETDCLIGCIRMLREAPHGPITPDLSTVT